MAFPLEKVNAACAFCFLFLDVSKPNTKIFNASLHHNPAWNICKPLKLMFANSVLPLASVFQSMCYLFFNQYTQRQMAYIICLCSCKGLFKRCSNVIFNSLKRLFVNYILGL